MRIPANSILIIGVTVLPNSQDIKDGLGTIIIGDCINERTWWQLSGQLNHE